MQHRAESTGPAVQDGSRDDMEFTNMWQEIFRLAVCWGAMAAIVGFWYWVIKNIGTF